jgi:hypothetical protein
MVEFIGFIRHMALDTTHEYMGMGLERKGGVSD